MSSAAVIVEVPVGELIKLETKTEKVTRYDQKTGAPYEKEEKEEFWTLCGKRVEPQEDPAYYPQELLDGLGLDCMDNGLEGKYRKIICGKIVGESVTDCNSRGKHFEVVAVEDIAEATLTVQNIFKQMGYEGHPKVYLAMHESF